LYRAVAIVEVALNTSITTTMQSLTSYSSNNLGDNMVCKCGLD